MSVSPFAPEKFPHLPPISGFDMAVAEAGIKYSQRTDVWVLRGAPGTQIAGVFTKNMAPGAPIIWSRQALASPVEVKAPRVIVVNSGTANVFTGAVGQRAVAETAQAAADIFGGQASGVFLASTGVIGEPLDAAKLVAQFPDMATDMQADGWEAGARAIMTTDTYAKGASIETEIDGVAVRINGIAKGSGMIAPDMATMLAFLATDANLSQDILQALLSDICGRTFNAITVDSDTSTSDTVLLAASGQVKHPVITAADAPALKAFRGALEDIMRDLAHQIVKDGEGAQKFIEVHVIGAISDVSAKIIALSVANSPLVKTAIAGEDANWGRIVMAVGKCGQPADRDRLSIAFGPHIVAADGFVAQDYIEDVGAEYMKKPEIILNINIGLGEGEARVWTCDLTHRYIDINADYRS